MCNATQLVCQRQRMMVGMLLVSTSAWSIAQEQTEPASEPAAAGVSYIALQDGSVDCAELFHAVSGELHWVAGSITAFTRGLGVQTNGMQRLPPERVDDLVARFPGVFSYRNAADGTHESLAVDVDALAKTLADQKSQLRGFLAGIQNQELASLRKIESTWSGQQQAPTRILVVMAGLHSLASSAEDVALQLHARTHLPACVFSYPNDGPIAESAGMLVLRLQDFHAQYPNSKVTLVAHSMGGLVSRAALEMQGEGATERSSVVDRTGVDQLIQVCPPNHGSALAEYGPLLEPAEQVYRLVKRNARRESRVLFRSIVDGFNEASADLAPNSRFLTELNKCPRNEQVRYSILAGDGGPLRGGMTSLLGNIWERISVSVDEPAELNRRISAVLACDELQNGKGDGVVSLESAKLDGVTDIEQLDMHHLVWDELDSPAGKNMLDAVAQRLGISL